VATARRNGLRALDASTVAAPVATRRVRGVR
jgi:hypothetical protein